MREYDSKNKNLYQSNRVLNETEYSDQITKSIDSENITLYNFKEGVTPITHKDFGEAVFFSLIDGQITLKFISGGIKKFDFMNGNNPDLIFSISEDKITESQVILKELPQSNKNSKNKVNNQSKMISLVGFQEQFGNESEYAYESRRLSFVINLLKDEIRAQQKGIIEIEILPLSVGYDNYEDHLTNRAIEDRSVKKIKEYIEGCKEPYFARIRFDKIKSSNFDNDIYISKKALSPKNQHYSVSWHTPIARLYYNKNEIEYMDKDNQTHKLNLRRSFEIKGSKLVEFYNEYEKEKEQLSRTITDPFLIKILEEKKQQTGITDIISTIQKKQYEIITKPINYSFVVQGCAGSGKSMILLHRISYLLYNNPLYNPKKIKIITQSKEFNAFIDKLRLDLGLELIRIITIEDYYLELLNQYIRESHRIVIKESKNDYNNWNVYIYKESFFKDVNELYRLFVTNFIGDIKIDRLNMIALKLRTHILDESEIKRDLYKVSNGFLNSLKDQYKIYYNKQSELYTSLSTLYKFNYKRNDLDLDVKSVLKLYCEKIIDEIFSEIKRKLVFIDLNKETELDILNISIDESFSSGRGRIIALEKRIFQESHKLVEENSKQEKNILDVDLKIIFSSLARVFTYMENYFEIPFVDQDDYNLIEYGLKRVELAKYDHFLKHAYNEVQRDIPRPKYSRSSNKRSDIWIKLICAYVYFGKNYNNDNYLNIDEAQDLSEFELRFLSIVNGENINMNIYGDVNQRTHEKGIVDFGNHYPSSSIYTFNQNYRNTVEVTNYANQKLRLDMVPIGINGPEVVVITENDAMDLIIEIVKEKNIIHAVIIIGSKSVDLSRELINLGCLEERTKEGKLTFYRIEQVKGMEFPTVIVFTSEMTKNEKYISYTRALSSLYVIEE